MKIHIVTLICAALILAACDLDNHRTNNISLPVTLSVAEQALGSDAYSIDPFRRNDITTPGIYNVRDQQARQICEYDTTLTSAISDMRKNSETFDQIIEDVVVDANLRVNVFGQTWDTPYRKVKITDYTVTTVLSGDSRAPAEWIIENLAAQCKEILQRNRPYIIVTEVAKANYVETVSGGGKVNFSFGIGPAVVTSQAAAYSNLKARKAVFAVAGELVPADE